MKFELGHNELGDADEPEYQLAEDLSDLFADVGFDAPQPAPVLRAEHRIAQKLHALSAERSDRARDLVDLQLLEQREELDLVAVAATCARLFDHRQQHAWPPTISLGANWDTLYLEAAEGLEVRPGVGEAVTWANEFIQRVATNGTRPSSANEGF